MESTKIINLIFIFIGITGACFTLYSVLIRNIKTEIQKMEEDIISKITSSSYLKHANH